MRREAVVRNAATSLGAALVAASLVGSVHAGVADRSASAVVPARTVWSADRLVKVTILRGALTTDVPIRIRVLTGRSIPKELRGEDSRVGKVYDLEPDGLRFRKPVTITRWLGGFDQAAGLPELFQFSRGTRPRWAPLTQQTISFDGKRVRVTGKTSHFSSFAVLDGGARFEVVPTPVVKVVDEEWDTSIVFDTDRLGDYRLSGTTWSANGSVALVDPEGFVSESARVTCTEVGPGTVKVNAVIADTSVAQAFTNLIVSAVPQGGVAARILLLAKATCLDELPPPPTCSQAPAAAATTVVFPDGSSHPGIQVTGQCDALLAAGLHHVRVDAPAGKQVYGYAAHTTGCDPATLPSTYLSCDVKPDGRICQVAIFGPQVAAGESINVRLEKADGQALQEHTLTVPATPQPVCPWGG